MAKGPKDQSISARLPVARVAVDISLAHLDRPFDYLVPASMDDTAVPGCRVRVRFAGQLVDGYLLDRTDSSEHQGKLARLERVTSPEPVLTPEIFDLARAVADRYAGTLADVLRLAIPPRHATAEREAPQAPPPDPEHPGHPDQPDRPRRTRSPAPGSATRPGKRSCRAEPKAVRSGPPGRPSPAPTGRPRSPSPPRPPRPRAAAPSSSSPTPGTWPASMRPSRVSSTEATSA